MADQSSDSTKYSVEVYGVPWVFTEKALRALVVKGPVTDATLRFCAINLGVKYNFTEEPTSFNYYDVPLTGQKSGEKIVISSEGP